MDKYSKNAKALLSEIVGKRLVNIKEVETTAPGSRDYIAI